MTTWNRYENGVHECRRDGTIVGLVVLSLSADRWCAKPNNRAARWCNTFDDARQYVEYVAPMLQLVPMNAAASTP